MSYTREISASVALLASIFGDPAEADAQANRYVWHLRFDGGHELTLRNLGTPSSAGRLQTWQASSATEDAFALLEARLEEADQYYEGPLHPELFLSRSP